MTVKYTILCVSIILFGADCNKFVQIDPPNNQLVTGSVFTSDAAATAAISGLYSKMIDGVSGFANGGVGSIVHLAGLSADEFISYTPSLDYSTFYVNSLASNNSLLLSNLWGQPYNYIY